MEFKVCELYYILQFNHFFNDKNLEPDFRFSRAAFKLSPNVLLFSLLAPQVYSDVDDTLQCSHEHNGAGVDTQLPSKTIYPGAVAFELALSRGVNNEPALPVVLLSARPRVKIVLAYKSTRLPHFDTDEEFVRV